MKWAMLETVWEDGLLNYVFGGCPTKSTMGEEQSAMRFAFGIYTGGKSY